VVIRLVDPPVKPVWRSFGCHFRDRARGVLLIWTGKAGREPRFCPAPIAQQLRRDQ
jgi:hypothetical protein